MCELVVWAKSQHSADPYHDAQCWKAGDVICVLEDGHEYGKAELAHVAAGEWQIVKLPGVPARDALSLEAKEPESDPSNPSRVRQRRMHRLDLTKPIKSHADLMSARVKKPALTDPNVLK